MNTQTAYGVFSWEFTSHYLRGAKENTCISPTGVYLLLSAIAHASTGETRQELDQALRLCRSEETHISRVKRLNDLLEACTVMSNETSIRVPAGLPLLAHYKRSISEAFGDHVRFGDSGTKAIVLENLIQFKDEWAVKFSETEGYFYRTPFDGTISFRSESERTIASQSLSKKAEGGTTIPFICQKNSWLSVREAKDYISVTVPFRSDCHMVLAMPKERALDDCLGDSFFLTQALTADTGLWCSKRTVDLYLPSFKIKNHARDIYPTLNAMGIDHVFDPVEGQITQMTEKSLYISSATQDAEVEVTAEGASAWALTRMEVKATCSLSSMPPHVPEIRFDHPFLFAIWQSKSEQVPLFMGGYFKTPSLSL